VELAIRLDEREAEPLHRRLYEALRAAILSGRLGPGQKVPSTRALASSLGVSRSTVTQSYEQLLGEGYLQAEVGSGTFVSRQLPEELGHAPKVEPPWPERAGGLPELSRYGASLLQSATIRAPGPEAAIDFRPGRPALDVFPWRVWRRLLLRHLRAAETAMLDYAEAPLGHRPLREELARFLARSRAVSCTAEQVLMVNGSQQAIDLVTRVLVEPGQVVALEDPGYLGARRAFLAQGARVAPVPVDGDGLEVEALSRSPAVQARLVYVTPSHQFPTGGTLALPRRLELLAWAERSGAVLVEDDYDNEYRYGGRPVPALQGLGRGAPVIYVGTFSKVLFPALRLGYVVAPPGLADVLGRAKALADRQSPLLEQYALADFVAEGHLERHLRRMRTLYAGRRRVLEEALEEAFGGRVEVLGDRAGMHLTARIETGLADEEAVRRAHAAGVGLGSLAPYCLEAQRPGEFLFGYASLGERLIREGVRRLAQALLHPRERF
jgi:GntR family transcriptional regulator / MocR family aminotransferase